MQIRNSKDHQRLIEQVCPRFMFSHSFIALSIICCLKSAQKSAVPVRQVTTVVIETTQLVPIEFRKFYDSQCRIE